MTEPISEAQNPIMDRENHHKIILDMARKYPQNIAVQTLRFFTMPEAEPPTTMPALPNIDTLIYGPKVSAIKAIPLPEAYPEELTPSEKEAVLAEYKKMYERFRQHILPLVPLDQIVAQARARLTDILWPPETDPHKKRNYTPVEADVEARNTVTKKMMTADTELPTNPDARHLYSTVVNQLLQQDNPLYLRKLGQPHNLEPQAVVKDVSSFLKWIDLLQQQVIQEALSLIKYKYPSVKNDPANLTCALSQHPEVLNDPAIRATVLRVGFLKNITQAFNIEFSDLSNAVFFNSIEQIQPMLSNLMGAPVFNRIYDDRHTSGWDADDLSPGQNRGIDIDNLLNYIRCKLLLEPDGMNKYMRLGGYAYDVAGVARYNSKNRTSTLGHPDNRVNTLDSRTKRAQDSEYIRKNPPFTITVRAKDPRLISLTALSTYYADAPLAFQKYKLPHDKGADCVTITSNWPVDAGADSDGKTHVVHLYLPRWSLIQDIKLTSSDGAIAYTAGVDYQLQYDPQIGYYRIVISNKALQKDKTARFSYQAIVTADSLKEVAADQDVVLTDTHRRKLRDFADIKLRAGYTKLASGLRDVADMQSPGLKLVEKALREGSHYAFADENAGQTEPLQRADQDGSMPTQCTGSVGLFKEMVTAVFTKAELQVFGRQLFHLEKAANGQYEIGQIGHADIGIKGSSLTYDCCPAVRPSLPTEVANNVADINFLQTEFEQQLLERAKRLLESRRVPSSYIFPPAVQRLTAVTDLIKRSLADVTQDTFTTQDLLDELNTLKDIWEHVTIQKPHMTYADQQTKRAVFGDYTNLAPIALAHIHILIKLLQNPVTHSNSE